MLISHSANLIYLPISLNPIRQNRHRLRTSREKHSRRPEHLRNIHHLRKKVFHPSSAQTQLEFSCIFDKRFKTNGFWDEGVRLFNQYLAPLQKRSYFNAYSFPDLLQSSQASTRSQNPFRIPSIILFITTLLFLLTSHDSHSFRPLQDYPI